MPTQYRKYIYLSPAKLVLIYYLLTAHLDKDKDGSESEKEELKPELERHEDGHVLLPAMGTRSLNDSKDLLREYVTTLYRKSLAFSLCFELIEN